MKKKSLILFGIVSFMACGNLTSHTDETTTESQDQNVHEGEILLKKNCYVCHNPNMETGRIAPPMQYVKEHYIKEGTTEKEFTEAFIDFIKHPTKAKAKMNGAIANFGLMPQQAFPKETLKKIAEYIYNHEIEEPDNPKGHKKGQNRAKRKHNKESRKVEMSKEDQGLEYALGTKAVLGKNLMGKIQSDGTIGALEFCNIHATSLTDSMANVYQATISRITDKPRNPNNLASKEEISTINFFKHRLNQNAEQEPVISKENGKTYFYYPIITNSMCLQCHGKEREDIDNSTLAKIKAYYPDDKATAYAINEVRGMWKVVFDD